MTEASRIPSKDERVTLLGQNGVFIVFRVHRRQEPLT
jgi:hypothetical protein